MRLAILGGSYLQKDMVLKALEMGHEVHAVAWREGEAVSDVVHGFHDVSLRDVDAVVKKCQELQIDGVVTTSSDVAVPAMAAVVKELGLIGISPEAAHLCTHKGRMREQLKRAGCAIPRFEVFSELPGDIGFEVPFVIKASDRSGSRGVSVIRDFEDWSLAFEYSQRVSFSGDVVVEEFFEGKQFSVEMMSQRGQHWFCGVTEEFFAAWGGVCEKGNLVPGRLEVSHLTKMISQVSDALDALGVRDGPSHSEVRINDFGDCCIIEVGARMGGDFRSRLVKLAYGIDMNEWAIKLALGQEVEMFNAEAQAKAMISWVFDSEDERSLRSVSRKPFCRFAEFFIEAKPGMKPLSSNERCGYVIVENSGVRGESWINGELKRNGW